jgi:hypothetical protein
MKLKCQVGEKYIWFVMCGLAGFWEVRGLDKILGILWGSEDAEILRERTALKGVTRKSQRIFSSLEFLDL